MLNVIRPVWETINETARRVLGRIEQTIEHAMAVDPGRFSGANPCDNVLRLLPRVSVHVQAETSDAVAGSARLLRRAAPAPGDRGTRAGTAVAYLLSEDRRGHPGDLGRDRRQPMERARRAHEIGCRPDHPARARAAMALLDSIRPVQITPDTLIFGSRRRGGSGRQTDDAMQTLIREKMALRYTVHGFRSSFMDWVAEVHPQRLLEAERALDHQIGNQVQRAYLRTDLLRSAQAVGRIMDSVPELIRTPAAPRDRGEAVLVNHYSEPFLRGRPGAKFVLERHVGCDKPGHWRA